jgi:hypothetical protein
LNLRYGNGGVVVAGINARTIGYLRGGVVRKHEDRIIAGTLLNGVFKYGACPRHRQCGGGGTRKRRGGTHPANADASMWTAVQPATMIAGNPGGMARRRFASVEFSRVDSGIPRLMVL